MIKLQKCIFFIVCMYSLVGRVHTQQQTYLQDYTIILEPTWKQLELNKRHTNHFQDKWILVGSIIFAKKAKNTVRLHRLCLKWHGTSQKRIIGSLYRRKFEKDFLPIEEYLIADGIWSETHQTLMFCFNNKLTLGALNEFFLVLTVASDLEPVLRLGHFTIEKHCLPSPFQNCACTDKLMCGIIDTTAQTTS